MIKTPTSKFYALTKNTNLGAVSKYLSNRLSDHGVEIQPYNETMAGIYQGGEKMGSLSFDDRFGIRIHSSDPLFGYEFGRLFDEQYEATHGFRWGILWSSKESDNKGIARMLTKSPSIIPMSQ